MFGLKIDFLKAECFYSCGQRLQSRRVLLRIENHLTSFITAKRLRDTRQSLHHNA
jgi:hypothetical protein